MLIAVLFNCQDSVIAQELHDMRVEVRKRAGSNNMRTKDSIIEIFWELIHQAEERHGIQRTRKALDGDEFNPVLAGEKKSKSRKRKAA